ncbi:MAG: tRNA pseudouridine(55) synthase TruB [Deltaproteobacteria bacterium]|nr:tRNA pseudouridine(55) synthase TruB [Deltaproteobacteria bacterium]
MTSFEVVAAVRRALGAPKAGHTGTLDPLATGVLPVCVGEATKIAGLLLGEEKEYRATGLLGVRTNTLDTDGEVVERGDPTGVTEEQLVALLPRWVGTLLQAPPAFSAVRVDGERAHARARRGEEVSPAARPVQVLRLELRRFELPRFEVELACSKGTYVRVLVDELGRALGCGASVAELRRVRSGGFDLSRAVPLEGLAERHRRGELPWVSMDEALSALPAVEVTPEAADKLRHGQPVAAEPQPGLVRVRLGGELVALGVFRGEGLWPQRVFRPSPSEAAEARTHAGSH